MLCNQKWSHIIVCAQVLLEVAASVQHLHNMQLLHCDIKPENVLLKSDNSNPLGFTTKLSDFGLAKLLRDNYYIINRSGSGTVTHLAPELFQVGTHSLCEGRRCEGVPCFGGVVLLDAHVSWQCEAGL